MTTKAYQVTRHSGTLCPAVIIARRGQSIYYIDHNGRGPHRAIWEERQDGVEIYKVVGSQVRVVELEGDEE